MQTSSNIWVFGCATDMANEEPLPCWDVNTRRLFHRQGTSDSLHAHIRARLSVRFTKGGGTLRKPVWNVPGSLLISACASGRAARAVGLSPELSRPATKLDICTSARSCLRARGIEPVCETSLTCCNITMSNQVYSSRGAHRSERKAQSGKGTHFRASGSLKYTICEMAVKACVRTVPCIVEAYTCEHSSCW